LSIPACTRPSHPLHCDLPSQLSGGDLDGDLFHVIWDPALFNAKPKLETFEPADYPRIPPLELEGEITIRDMANFFADFKTILA